jgi:anti-sigma factor RsiW
VGCNEIEPLIEAIADGSVAMSDAHAAHLASCARCAAQLERARAIEGWLALREAAVPPPSFTASVMAQIVNERWKAERVIDLGFNLAIAAGVIVILAGGAGLAWSLGFLNVTIDLDAIWQAFAATEVTGRFLSQLQTFMMAAVILTMALVLWWWAETAAD